MEALAERAWYGVWRVLAVSIVLRVVIGCHWQVLLSWQFESGAAIMPVINVPMVG